MLDVVGITAIGFADQHLFTTPGYLHDLHTVLEFQERSDGRCWKTVVVSSPGPTGSTFVHTLLVKTETVFCLKISPFQAPQWVIPDRSVSIQLRKLHSR